MDNIFLLTGKPRVGKTTALKKIIDEVGAENCSGFYTEEIRDENDRTGFKCVTFDGKEAVIADVGSKSEIRIGRYGMEIAEFEKLAIPALKESLLNQKITIIDEIGPMQMLSPQFRDIVWHVLKKSEIVLGTICYDSHPYIDEIKMEYQQSIYTLTPDNRNHITSLVIQKISV